jgi:hypothetical protein
MKGDRSRCVICTPIVVDPVCGGIAACGIVDPKTGEQDSRAGVVDLDSDIVFVREAFVGVFSSEVAAGGSASTLKFDIDPGGPVCDVKGTSCNGAEKHWSGRVASGASPRDLSVSSVDASGTPAIVIRCASGCNLGLEGSVFIGVGSIFIGVGSMLTCWAVEEDCVASGVCITMALGAPGLLGKGFDASELEGGRWVRWAEGAADWAIVVAGARWQLCSGAEGCLFPNC